MTGYPVYIVSAGTNLSGRHRCFPDQGIPHRGILNEKEHPVGLKRGYTISRGLVISILVGTLLSVGTAGYMLISDLSFIDALYMTFITVSTVGFREVTKFDTAGKVFTIIIILGGLSIISYALVELGAFFVDGGMRHIIRRRTMKKRIAELKDHIIVCGAGQTGASVLEQFRLAETDCVVIESDEERIRELNDSSLLVIHGDATNEDVLEEAGIDRARGVVCCLANDADTVYTVLTARGMNPNLQIVARAIEKGTAGKLKRAGADKTISVNELGGMRMAYLMLRPHVVSFLDAITRFDDEVLDLGEVTVQAGSALADSTLKDARLPEKTGLIIIAMRKVRGKLRFNPGPKEVLSAGCSVLVLGKDEQIHKLTQMAENSEAPDIQNTR